MTAEARCVWDAKAGLGEGPVWLEDGQAVYWVDILGGRIHRYAPATGERRTWTMAEQVCSITPRAAGGFVAATRHGFAFFDPETGALEPFAAVEPDRPGNRFNDAKADDRGRLWAGTMNDDGSNQPTGALYRLDADLAWRRMDDGYRVANGPAFSLDGRTMFHNDTRVRRVYAFDVDAAGGISGKRVFLEFAEADGKPDGMTVDAEGFLWVAHYGGGRVSRFAPDGRAERHFNLPATQVTSCVFGGPALDVLYVTTAAQRLDAEALSRQPLAGGLFAIAAGVRGRPTARFAG